MNPFAFFTRRFRGFRVVDLMALAVLLVLAFGVYAFKTLAGAQSADTVNVERQIVEEQKRVRLLDAEVAHLEDPARIERLSSQFLGLKAVDAQHETTEDALPQIAERDLRARLDLAASELAGSSAAAVEGRLPTSACAGRANARAG